MPNRRRATKAATSRHGSLSQALAQANAAPGTTGVTLTVEENGAHTPDGHQPAVTAPSISSDVRLFLLSEQLLVLLPRLRRVSKGQNQKHPKKRPI